MIDGSTLWLVVEVIGVLFSVRFSTTQKASDAFGAVAPAARTRWRQRWDKSSEARRGSLEPRWAAAAALLHLKAQSPTYYTLVVVDFVVLFCFIKQLHLPSFDAHLCCSVFQFMMKTSTGHF